MGSGAFDPRSFAASWAAERGVGQPTVATVNQPASRARTRRRLGVLAALAGSALVGLVVLVGAARVFGRVRTSRGIAGPAIRRVPFPPFPRMRVGPLNMHVASFRDPIGAIGLLALFVVLLGITGLIVTVLLWRRWENSGRWSRRHHDRDETRESQYS